MGRNWGDFVTPQNPTMYINNEEKKAKIGRVSVSVNRDNSIRIRFTYPKGTRHDFVLTTYTNEGWVKALRLAQTINADIELEQFDNTLVKYGSKKSQTLEISQKQPNLIEIWERYKELNKYRIALTTQKYLWRDCDRYLSRVDKKLLTLDKAPEFLAHLQTKYAVSTISTLFRSCLNPAVNQVVSENPFRKLIIPKHPKTPNQCYETWEIKEILRAFKENTYRDVQSPYYHSYYYAYVSFLALTGCRPEEAICLTYEDIKKNYIRFSKAYSKGILLPYTKTKEIRMFPCNEQLTFLLTNIPRTSTLLFPSVKGKYINHSNWRKRNWVKVIQGLRADGILEEYYKPYSLRHSFVTRLIREGYDIKTVAALSGHSFKTLLSHYLVINEDIDIPEL